MNEEIINSILKGFELLSLKVECPFFTLECIKVSYHNDDDIVDDHGPYPGLLYKGFFNESKESNKNGGYVPIERFDEVGLYECCKYIIVSIKERYSYCKKENLYGLGYLNQHKCCDESEILLNESYPYEYRYDRNSVMNGVVKLNLEKGYGQSGSETFDLTLSYCPFCGCKL
jgi:hypothetical protein